MAQAWFQSETKTCPLMYSLRFVIAATVALKEKFFLNLLLSLSSVRFQEGAKWFSSNLEMAVWFFPHFAFFSRICLSTITTSAHCVPSTILLSLPFHSLLLLCHRNILNTKDLMEIATFINSTNLCQRKLINMKSTVGVSTQIKIKMGATLFIEIHSRLVAARKN